MASASIESGLDQRILTLLEQRGTINTNVLANELGVDHQLVVGAVKSLHSLGDVRT